MSRKMPDELKKIIDKGHNVYSISKINTKYSCPYAYYLTYIENQKGLNNIYGVVGSKIHDIIEDIYKNNANTDTLKNGLDEILNDCKVIGISFPNEDIERNWKENMYHFVENFSKMKRKFNTEEFILYEIKDGKWIQGYIDAIEYIDNKNINILDWKTSSKFSGNKLKEAGRQLITYKLAKESQGYKVNNIGWFMTKYINVCYKNILKSGKVKVKTKMCERRKWVKEMNVLSKAKGTTFWEQTLLDYGEDPFDVEFMIQDAIINNNISNFPKEIKEQFWLEDCIVWYDATDELIKETKEYLISGIDDIESRIEDEIDWNAVDINEKNEFFCFNLCNHRKDCKYLIKYRENKLKNDTIMDDEDDDLF